MHERSIISTELVASTERAETCGRCGGRMIPEYFHHGTGVFHGWKCVLCGEVVDPIILLNRARQSLGNTLEPKGKYA